MSVEKWDIIERKWKVDWAVEESKADIDVAVKVQIGIIADCIEEIKARHVIAKIVSESKVDYDDPSYV